MFTSSAEREAPSYVDNIDAQVTTNNGLLVATKVVAVCSLVQTLNVTVGPGIDTRNLIQFLDGIPNKRLERLQLFVDFSTCNLASALVTSAHISSFCGKTPTLRSISICPEMLSRQLLGALSTLPALVELTVAPWTTSIPRTQFVDPTSPGSSLRRLRVLKLAARVPFDLVHALPVSPQVPTLTMVLDSYGMPHEMLATMKIVPPYCQLLAHIDIDIKHGGPNELSLTDLQPFTSIKTIKAIKVSYLWPILFDQDDLKALFMSWPCLKTLVLNPRPSLGVPPSVILPPLDSLNVVATCGPSLELFAACIDAREPLRQVQAHNWAPSIMFLDFGLSLGPDAEDECLTLGKQISELFGRVNLPTDDCNPWVQNVKEVVNDSCSIPLS